METINLLFSCIVILFHIPFVGRGKKRTPYFDIVFVSLQMSFLKSYYLLALVKKLKKKFQKQHLRFKKCLWFFKSSAKQDRKKIN